MAAREGNLGAVWIDDSGWSSTKFSTRQSALKPHNFFCSAQISNFFNHDVARALFKKRVAQIVLVVLAGGCLIRLGREIYFELGQTI
jgi:hypothetical protein